jgi:sporulation protein YunB
MAISSGIFFFVDRSITPSIIAISEATVEYRAQQALNTAVKETLTPNLNYSDLVTILTNASGDITLIQSNTLRMNSLSAMLSAACQEKISALGVQGINVPLGSITGSKILAGRGPKIAVKIIPLGSVSSEFVSEFETSGINQTRHRIHLVIQAHVKIVVPLSQKNIDVYSKIPISECIIVGDVPDTFLTSESRDDLLNLVPVD